MIVTPVFHEDPVYGSAVIDDPALIDLMGSRAVTRLKGIMQHGVSALIGVTAPVTRYDHSVGTMLLVRRLGGGIEEQIAALLHDVSHTIFSHVIDYVFDDHDGQSFHDRHARQYVATTDIPDISAYHGYQWSHLFDESRYTLLEQPAPALCADRLDYFFRDALDLGLARRDEIDQVLSDLQTIDGRVVCRNQERARWLADTYMAADDASWSNFREVGLYELTARAIRRALATGVLERPDLWGVDGMAWAALKGAKDSEIVRNLSLVTPQTRFTWDEKAPTFVVNTKVRTIDPDVFDGRCIRQLSTLDSEFADRQSRYRERKQGPWPMRVVT